MGRLELRVVAESLEMMDLADARGLARARGRAGHYNLLNRAARRRVLRLRAAHPIHTTVYNPLAGGLLTGKHAPRARRRRGRASTTNALYQRRYWSRAMFELVERSSAPSREPRG